MLVVDQIEADMASLVEVDFGKRPLPDELSRRFIDWLHFKARRIPSVPRRVVVSNEVSVKRSTYPAVTQILGRLAIGSDVSPWLSSSIRDNKQAHAIDKMFNEWQIAHFHLGGVFSTPVEIARTKPLLFVHITGIEATALDIQAHGAWNRTELIDILARTNTKAGYRMKGMSDRRLTDDEHAALRRANVNSMIPIEGDMFSPGMGLTSSGHALRLQMYFQWFQRARAQVKSSIESSQISSAYHQQVYSLMGVPVRLGVVFKNGGLAIVDRNRNNLTFHAMRTVE